VRFSKIPYRLVFLALAALLCTVCGEPSPTYYPLTPHRWWLYQIETHSRRETGHHRLVIHNLAHHDNNVLQRRQGEVYRLSEGPEGIFQVSPERESATRQLIVPTDPKIDQQWTFTSQLALIESGTFAAEDKLRGRRLPIVLTARVISRDAALVTPAGTFRSCLHLRATGKRLVRIDRGNAFAEVSVTQQEWYAPNLGLVKRTRVERAKSHFLHNGHYVQTLVEFGP
jgi:hypothetical protein